MKNQQRPPSQLTHNCYNQNIKQEVKPTELK